MEIITTISLLLLPFLLNAKIYGNGNKIIAQKFILNQRLSFWLGVVLGGLGMIIVFFQARVFTFKKFGYGCLRFFIAAFFLGISSELEIIELNGLVYNYLNMYVVLPYALRGKNMYNGILDDF